MLEVVASEYSGVPFEAYSRSELQLYPPFSLSNLPRIYTDTPGSSRSSCTRAMWRPRPGTSWKRPRTDSMWRSANRMSTLSSYVDVAGSWLNGTRTLPCSARVWARWCWAWRRHSSTRQMYSSTPWDTPSHSPSSNIWPAVQWQRTYIIPRSVRTCWGGSGRDPSLIIITSSWPAIPSWLPLSCFITRCLRGWVEFNF